MSLLSPTDRSLTTEIGKSIPAKAVSPVQGVTPAPTAPSTTPINPVPGAKPVISQTMQFQGKLDGSKMMPRPYNQVTTTRKVAGVDAANQLIALLDASAAVKRYHAKKAAGSVQKPDITEILAMAVLQKHAKTRQPRNCG
jgi:hypothetical protein